MSKARENSQALSSYLDSLCCGVDKALRGSDCEDMYIMEKLSKFAARMGYKLTKMKGQNMSTTQDEFDCPKCGQTAIRVQDNTTCEVYCFCTNSDCDYTGDTNTDQPLQSGRMQSTSCVRPTILERNMNMNKYKIEIHETASRIVEVEAKDKYDAIDKVEQSYADGDIILDYNDYQNVEFNII